jgi:hypothetical protein
MQQRKLSRGRTTILKTGRDDSTKAFAARQSPSVK